MATSEGRELVCVLGPGRSGTSTMAGTLAHSGFHVPDAIRGDQTNPSGFFEPRWVVDFHRDLLELEGVRNLDADPNVLDRLQRFMDDEQVRQRLREWLDKELAENPRLVIKDPRMVWFRGLWQLVAQELGVEPTTVIMLRHPAEVSSSRNEYYNARVVPGVAGWVNVALVAEQLTHGTPRLFVRYHDLTADWRVEASRFRELGVELTPPPDTRPHPVDDFIDPRLARMKPGWEDLEVPGYLQRLGDRTFDALGELADHGESDRVGHELESIRQDYARLYADSLALVNASTSRAQTAAARKAARRARAKARRETSTPSREPGGAATRVRHAIRRRLKRG
ncbi:MAG: sulfotransferase family protein [Marmoricola sp.]